MKNIQKHIHVKVEMRIGDDLYYCYYRNELVNDLFGPSSRVDPVQCTFKGRVTVTGSCYYASNGNEITIENLNLQTTVRFYDIDYERALTEFG